MKSDRELLKSAKEVLFDVAVRQRSGVTDNGAAIVPFEILLACADMVAAIEDRLAQPEQEPWGYISHKSWKMPVFVEADNLEVSGLPFNNPNYTPVYKTPPQRDGN